MSPAITPGQRCPGSGLRHGAPRVSLREASKVRCPVCGRSLAASLAGKIRTHIKPRPSSAE